MHKGKFVKISGGRTMNFFLHRKYLVFTGRKGVVSLLGFLFLLSLLSPLSFGQQGPSPPKDGVPHPLSGGPGQGLPLGRGQAGQGLPGQGKKLLTVERIYGEPSLMGRLPWAVQWSPDGKMITYLHLDKKTGKVDLWYYDVRSGKRHLLVDSDKLILPTPPKEKKPPRFRISRYLWSPTGEELLFPSKGDLFIYNLKTGQFRQLTQTKEPEKDPKFSPDGRYVAFIREYNLYALDLRTGDEIPLTTDGNKNLMNGQVDWVYDEEFDLHTGYWWSPDSKYIAYLQFDESPVPEYPIVDFIPYHATVTFQKYPKAGDPNPILRVGVVSLETRQTVWMDTGDETDIYIPRVTWLPDGKHLAIQVLNRDQTQLDLLLADVRTGRTSGRAGRRILREEQPCWINIRDDLYFFKDKPYFIWSSERDGFRHLYLYNTQGKLIRRLTRGSWQVEELCGVDEKAKMVYFTATEKSPLERHLYRVRLNGRGFRRLTSQAGTHRIVMSPDSRHFLDYYSDVKTPTQLTLYRANGRRVAILEENRVPELEEYALSEPEFLTLASEDGDTLYALMIKPPDFDPTRKYPVIVRVYGGPHGQVVRNSFRTGWGSLWHQMMAQKGYIIFSLDNRGSWGRGKRWEDTIYRRFGEVELRDQLQGVRYLKSLPFVDSTRIGIWGWSYGGYMTCYAMFRAPEVFKVGVAVAPVTDWRDYDTIYTERYMDRPQDNPEGYKQSSPVNYAANLKGKLLIIHGTSDDNVHFQNTVQLVDELIKAGKSFDLMIYPRKSHGIGGKNARIHLFNLITNYFLENL